METYIYIELLFLIIALSYSFKHYSKMEGHTLRLGYLDENRFWRDYERTSFRGIQLG